MYKEIVGNEFWKAEQDGAELEGIFRGITETASPDDSEKINKNAQIETKDGKKILVGYTVVVSKLQDAEALDKKVKIVRNGKIKSKTSKQTYFDFSVFVDDGQAQ